MLVSYVRYPTIAGDRIVYVSEDDLWEVSSQGGAPRRLTALRTPPAEPLLSPDGQDVVFIGHEEGGSDAYVVRLGGGPVRRLTHLGGVASVAGFDPTGRVVVSTGARSPFAARRFLYAVDPDGGEPSRLAFGPATGVAFGPDGHVALERGSGREPAHWKRYRGGRMGRLWIRRGTEAPFVPLTAIAGNVQSPMWLGERLYFLSDHDGYGNLYSCLADGTDLRRHTSHGPEYARNARSDGSRIVYHAAGGLFVYEPGSDRAERVEIDGYGGGRRPARRFVDAASNWTEYELHPDGRSVLLVTRGKPFVMGAWEGAAVELGEPQGVRYRQASFLPDGERVVTVSDAGGEERLEIHRADGRGMVARLEDADPGFVQSLSVRPTGAPMAAVTNERMELLLVHLESGTCQVADRAVHGRIGRAAWSPDGRYLVYSYPDSRDTRALRLFDCDAGTAHSLTRPVLRDYAPVFDPAGKYIYFLSKRTFDPVADNLEFGFSFPRGARPYLLVLRQDGEDPFRATPRPFVHNGKGEGEGDEGADTRVQIDLEGIEDRVLAFPMPEGRYEDIAAIDGKLLVLEEPIEGAGDHQDRGRGRGVLRAYDFAERKSEFLADRMDGFALSFDGKAMAYRSGRRLRVVRAGTKVEDGRDEGPGRRSGWVNLERAKVEVDFAREWQQMVRDAWRQMRAFFWTADMGGVDWTAVYERYAALALRVGSRDELSDLLWEMQGEMGTSHAYEMSESPEGPRYPMGTLAADYAWDGDAGGYRIERIVCGDTWAEGEDSPLRRPGAGVRVGDVLVAVNGRALDPVRTPEAAMVDLGGEEVELRVRTGAAERSVTVKTLRSETGARYREWVDRNRAYVHEVSGGRVGYVHVPDMMYDGYAEFHRGYLAESQRDALILDVRYNRGGAVSWLLMDKLRRRVVSYRMFRDATPHAFPLGSVRGPIVCLTNAYAGSDGDAICQEFKAYQVGPVIGTRTWGGTIGISSERRLVDGSAVTQPEMRRWFVGVGWGLENHGVDPDIEVEERPEDAARGHDTQLERAAAEILRLLEDVPPLAPPDPATAPPSGPPQPRER